jgi:acyl carrier protein
MGREIFTDADVRDLLVVVGMEPSVDSQVYGLTFEALELDSLARVEIASRLRDRYGVEVEEELTADTTPDHLKQLVNQRLSSAAQA